MTSRRSTHATLAFVLVAGGLSIFGCRTAATTKRAQWRPDPLVAPSASRPRRIASPDGQQRVDVWLQGDAVAFAINGEVVTGTLLKLRFADAAPLQNLEIVDDRLSRRDELYTMPAGKRSRVRDRCVERTIAMRERSGAHRSVDVIVRAYDDGIAFRYRLPGSDEVAIVDEGTSFRIDRRAQAWALPSPTMHSHYEYEYEVGPLEQLKPRQIYGMPLLVRLPDAGPAIAITEAALLDHAASYLKRDAGDADDGASTTTLRSILSPPTVRPGASSPPTPTSGPIVSVRARLPHTSPWRVIMLGETPARLIESDLVQTLAEPSRIDDTSWVKPGKVSFLWWNGYVVDDDAGFEGALDTRTLKHYIDFAAEHGIPYVSIDGFHGAWYGGPNHPWQGADITKAIPELDVRDVIAYAKARGVRIRLWVNTGGLRRQMEQAIPLYASWGVEGIMADFVERDDQADVQFQTSLLDLCARNQLTVTFHNCPKPTGLTRTYPNLLSIEAVRNLEYNKFANERPVTPEQELIVPFVRMLAGPVDFHSGGFRAVRPDRFVARDRSPLVIGTRSRMLASYIVLENPMPMIADDPGTYRANEPTFQFIRDVPVTWDETRVLAGEVGDFLVIARRKGQDWYVGAMTDASPRQLKVSTSFLPRGDFAVSGWTDGPDDSDPNQAIAVQQAVTSRDTLEIRLSSAGGYAVKIAPASQPSR